MLKDVEALGSYSVTCVVEYDLGLCLLALRSSQKVDWSRYGSTDDLFQGYDFRSVEAFDIPLLGHNGSLNKCYTRVIEALNHKPSPLRIKQFVNMNSCEVERVELSNVADLSGGGGIVADV